MSGARLPHLERRQGMWNIRIRVPDSVKLRVGLLEVRRSLRTYSSERARLLAVQLIAQLQEIFRMAATDLLSKDEARRLIQACFDRLVTESEAHAPVFDDPGRELNEQRWMIDDRLRELRLQVRSGKYEADVHAMLASLLRAHGPPEDNVSPGLKRDLLEGVARALAEQERLSEFRLGERLMPYEPADPLFDRARERTPVHLPVVAAPPSPQSTVVGPTVQEAVDRYLAAKRKSWRPKTLQNFKRQLSLLVDHLGPGQRLRLVTTEGSVH